MADVKTQVAVALFLMLALTLPPRAEAMPGGHGSGGGSGHGSSYRSGGSSGHGRGNSAGRRGGDHGYRGRSDSPRHSSTRLHDGFRRHGPERYRGYHGGGVYDYGRHGHFYGYPARTPRHGYRGHGWHGPRLFVGYGIASVPYRGYSYYDTYCDQSWYDLDLYLDHVYEYGHPSVIQVIDVHTGYPVAWSDYRDGEWAVIGVY